MTTPGHRQLAGLFVLFACLPLIAQQAKRPLTHDDYDGWQSLSGRTISEDGAWVAFTVAPQVGDGTLVIRQTEGEVEYRHALGTAPRFTEDGKYCVFRIDPSREAMLAVERAKLRKKTEDRKRIKPTGDAKIEIKIPDKPLPSVAMLNLASGEVATIDRTKGFSVPREGPSYCVVHLEKEEKKKDTKAADQKKPEAGGESAAETKTEEPPAPEPEAPTKPAEPKSEGKKPAAKKPEAKKPEPPSPWREDGTTLLVRDLVSGVDRRIPGVVRYGITSKRGILWWVTNSKKDDEKIGRGLFAQRLGEETIHTLVEGAANYQNLTTDREVTRLCFLSDRVDREAEKPSVDLYHWDLGAEHAEILVSHTDRALIPAGYRLAASGLRFCYDGSVLQFDIEEQPEADEPLILDEERVSLDLWHWQDPLLQPMQQKQIGSLKSTKLACVWQFDADKMTVVGKDPRESMRFLTPDGSRLLASDSTLYAKEVSWDGRYTDYFVVNAVDGSRRLVATRVYGSAQTSPDGRWMFHFDDGHWYSTDLAQGGTQLVSGDIPVSLEREDWDTPSPARPWGIAGFTPGDARVLIYDRYDIWSVRPDGTNAICVTDGFGRATETRLRLVRLDPEERFYSENVPLLLSAMNLSTMASGFYEDQLGGMSRPKKLMMVDENLGRVTKAKGSDRLFFTAETFQKSPDLWMSADRFASRKKLSTLNPQQDEFRWGDAELVSWRSADGIPLKGILIKPEGFDPKKKYPLMVYFYERMSERLHRYQAPQPGTSPNSSYYVSNGYLWFIPDIVYREGYPGESCLKCLVPGVLELIDRGFVDETAIGAAGHSWGGYQTAYLVTRTNLFAAVESGAPVANMTSAYGGIRWGSGMSRAFQYEKTQSRIGGSLWEYPIRYLENSPIFAADKVETPVLMLHNDKDGAVPWYQGIEYFCALRRLGKEAYMFNYVGEDHGLRRRANMLDWSQRMQQYFDHHLKGAPAPEWMDRGVPYAERSAEKLRFRRPVESLRALETPVP
ncbi:MAG: S9 family peptidase, partial [Planctomycetes bacterium]|nr:S9 family peptidase [Planctomycetota bacterium]